MGEFIEKLSTQVTEEQPSKLLAYLRDFCGNDLEAIMGELDTLIGMKYAQKVEGSRILSIGSGNSTRENYVLYISTAIRLQWLIKHAVIREYRNVNQDQVDELYESLFDELFNRPTSRDPRT